MASTSVDAVIDAYNTRPIEDADVATAVKAMVARGSSGAAFKRVLHQWAFGDEALLLKVLALGVRPPRPEFAALVPTAEADPTACTTYFMTSTCLPAGKTLLETCTWLAARLACAPAYSPAAWRLVCTLAVFAAETVHDSGSVLRAVEDACHTSSYPLVRRGKALRALGRAIQTYPILCFVLTSEVSDAPVTAADMNDMWRVAGALSYVGECFTQHLCTTASAAVHLQPLLKQRLSDLFNTLTEVETMFASS